MPACGTTPPTRRRRGRFPGPSWLAWCEPAGLGPADMVLPAGGRAMAASPKRARPGRHQPRLVPAHGRTATGGVGLASLFQPPARAASAHHRPDGVRHRVDRGRLPGPGRPADRAGLRDPGGAGPRRHGRGLQGPAGAAQARRRPQDDPGRRLCRRRSPRPLPGRGRGGGPPAASQHRADLRDRRARRPAVLLAGVRGGRQPARPGGRAAAAAPGRRAGPDPGPGRCTRPMPSASSIAT